MPSLNNIPPGVRIVDGEDSLVYKAFAGTVSAGAKVGATALRGIGAATIWTGKNVGIPLALGTIKGLGSLTIGAGKAVAITPATINPTVEKLSFINTGFQKNFGYF